MEDGAAPDRVSSVRLMMRGAEVVGKERLLAHSDAERTFTYEIAEPVEGFDIENYRATVTVKPVTTDGGAFVSWEATFDSDLGRREHWETHFATVTFGGQVESLRTYLAR
jgi:hypothetical protein